MSNLGRTWIWFFSAALGCAGFAAGQSYTRSPRPATLAPRSAVAAQAQGGACGPVSATESSSDTVVFHNSVACATPSGHANNRYWRAYDPAEYGITHDFAVCNVQIGVEEASSGSGNGQPITLNLYSSSQPFPGGFPGSLTLIGTTGSITVADQALTLLDVPVAGTVPAGTQLVVEVFTPDGQLDGNLFFIGSNAETETHPSYVSAAACSNPTPVTTADAGFPDMHIVETVTGAESIGGLNAASLVVDPLLGAAEGNANGVFELNEGDVLVAPGWTNGSEAAFTLTGIARVLLGGTGTTNVVVNDTADYGLIASGATADCLTAGGDCYVINVTGDRGLQPVHFDLVLDEDVTALAPLPLTDGPPPAPDKEWKIHVGASFADVGTDPFYPFIETILHNGVTAGCGAGTTYCPLQNNLRQETAVFLLKGFLGSGYAPPNCAGLFQDVPCPPTPGFPYSNFIEDLFKRGITTGCQIGPPALFCPDSNVTRAQMAPFLLKTLLGGGYTPSVCTSLFQDVPCPPTPEFPYSNFIEDLFKRGITTGCQVGPPALYCPDNPVTRQEIAAFLTLTFSLVLYGP
jgi:hypothetical protein